jgi:DNA-binding ferritin-like protein
MEKEFAKMASMLLSSQTQTHIFHLQTESYAEHKALQKYYEGIDPLLDALVEDYQGEHGIVKGYTSYKMVEYSASDAVIKYFDELKNAVTKMRTSVGDYSNLQNQIDNIITLINSTVYKLKNLK